MLPQTLLTDLGHVYSLKLKHRQPISVPHRVTYFTLLTTTLFFRALKKLFSRKRSGSHPQAVSRIASSFLHHNKQGHQLALLNQHILLSKGDAVQKKLLDALPFLSADSSACRWVCLQEDLLRAQTTLMPMPVASMTGLLSATLLP
jgi:hypothetical protein